MVRLRTANGRITTHINGDDKNRCDINTFLRKMVFEYLEQRKVYIINNYDDIKSRRLLSIIDNYINKFNT